jgi:ribulose-phosphate 3-epimerase
MIIPALLESSLASLKTKVQLFEQISPLLHVDFGDSKFVELKSEFTIEDVANLTTSAKLQVHLMCLNPENQIQKKYNSIDSVIFHAEAVKNYLKTAQVFHLLGYKVGICVNLRTPPPDYFDKIDFIQFMGVIPGKQHGIFDQTVIKKIHKFNNSMPTLPIQVDGGLNSTNIPDLINAGASTFAVGSFILKAESHIQAYKELCGI